MTLAIETCGLTRRFGGRTAVQDLAMQVPPQAVYGFLGPNGAGKTTTLKMLLGLIRPSEGRALIEGIDVAADRMGAARKVGALLEAHGFHANLTGRENLEITRRLLALPREETDRVLEVVEMRPDAHRRVSDYSLGMRQRLGIARALLGAPPVLILDEPTNGLDPDGIVDMRGFLAGLPARTGATVLVSSHLLNEVEQTATHVGVILAGRLAVQGALADLTARAAPGLDVEVDQPDRARPLLLARGFDLLEGDALSVRLRPGDDVRAAAAGLNRALVEAGIAVFALTPRRPGLETLYRRVADQNRLPTASKEAA
ncbi:ABC transporter ATP-binding protein [Brevundimonas sp.]|uniref:ABC transporter ATP-binding protein n=1 Tax=Brevundimonas sp. TaxID=1871086 RepID=UPI001DFFB11E|nr:ABC transporter ATP-binding protein [Brevundimonas sp.]MBA3999986.1 ABC transporter ATP-binding protein [Brevundimonas sp.]